MAYERPYRKSPEKKHANGRGAVQRKSVDPISEILLPCKAVLFRENRHYKGVVSILYEGNQSDAIHYRGVFFDRESQTRKYFIPITKMTKSLIEFGEAMVEYTDQWGDRRIKKPDLDEFNYSKLEFIIQKMKKGMANSKIEKKTLNSAMLGQIRKYFSKECVDSIRQNNNLFYRVLSEIKLPVRIPKSIDAEH